LWTYYENGEIVNKASGLCLDINGQKGGKNSVGTYACEDALD
jgi:hypothetical protein